MQFRNLLFVAVAALAVQVSKPQPHLRSMRCRKAPA